MKFPVHGMRSSLFKTIISQISGILFLTLGAYSQPDRQNSTEQDRLSTATKTPSASSVMAEANADYRISPGDVIEIIIEDAPELSRNYRVTAGGSFEMQVLGRITARRKTTEELAKMIADQLRGQDYLKNPNVVVAIKQYNSQTFFIQGAVNRPGVYQLEGRPSLLMMIGLAGGLTDSHGATAFIIRKVKASKPQESTIADRPSVNNPPASPEASGASLQAASTSTQETDQDLGADYELLRINLSALYKGQFAQNQSLEPGDIVNIPRTDVFFVAGEVQAPGSFPLKEGTTLRQAISLAQGLSFKAKAGAGIIFREDPTSGSRQEMKVDIGAVMGGKHEDIAILANDVIIIPNSRSKSVGGALLMAFGVNTARMPIRF
jgi:polysaccharide biosynthesis/export protein